MIKIGELKPGDIVLADYEGSRREGVVTEVNREDGLACVETEVQAFWYAPEQLYSIPLTNEQLLKLGFERHENGEIVKYMKGAFRVQAPKGGDFSDFEIWYREDHRHLRHAVSVHELQNHYYQMTKVELNQD